MVTVKAWLDVGGWNGDVAEGPESMSDNRYYVNSWEEIHSRSQRCDAFIHRGKDPLVVDR